MMTRYHLDTTTPVRPPMADAVHQAALCGDGSYRQCIDVPAIAVTQFERWAERNEAIIRYERH